MKTKYYADIIYYIFYNTTIIMIVHRNITETCSSKHVLSHMFNTWSLHNDFMDLSHVKVYFPIVIGLLEWLRIHSSANFLQPCIPVSHIVSLKVLTFWVWPHFWFRLSQVPTVLLQPLWSWNIQKLLKICIFLDGWCITYAKDLIENVLKNTNISLVHCMATSTTRQKCLKSKCWKSC